MDEEERGAVCESVYRAPERGFGGVRCQEAAGHKSDHRYGTVRW